jgi:hypothetical protein
MTHSLGRWRWVIVLAATTVACSRQDPPKIPLARAVADSARSVEAAHALIGPEVKAALDSGNVLFRHKEYDAALAQYRTASALAPQHAAPLFGIYMVARATNNSVMADSALEGIRLRNGPMAVGPHTFGDSSMQRAHAAIRGRG